MSDLIELLQTLNFPRSSQIQGHASVTDLFPVGKRCGIYVLQFLSGEAYAGQAIDLTHRYIQHCKAHDDISSISFKRVSKANLNDEERVVIWAFEQNGIHLRNIVFTSIPKGDSDFDLVMPVEKQQKSLNTGQPDYSGVKVQEDTLRRKNNQKFQRFLKQPQSESSIALLRRYIRQAIPIPLRSEVSFWSCSCLPSYMSSGITLYSRININWQEVFTVFTEQGVPVASLYLALSPLKQGFGTSLELLFEKFPTLTSTEHFTSLGGKTNFILKLQEQTLYFPCLKMQM